MCEKIENIHKQRDILEETKNVNNLSKRAERKTTDSCSWLEMAKHNKETYAVRKTRTEKKHRAQEDIGRDRNDIICPGEFFSSNIRYNQFDTDM